MTAPTVTVSRRRNVIAGEFRYTATVTYPGEPPEKVTFQSSDYGPPIVMLTAGMPGGVFVSGRVLDRIGSKLTPEWVRAFFGAPA